MFLTLNPMEFIFLNSIRFARASSHAADFNTRNKLLTQKLLKKGFGYHKRCKTFSKFYCRYFKQTKSATMKIFRFFFDFFKSFV